MHVFSAVFLWRAVPLLARTVGVLLPYTQQAPFCSLCSYCQGFLQPVLYMLHHVCATAVCFCTCVSLFFSVVAF